MSQALLFLADVLPAWYAQNARRLPWRESNDPYRVWLSEIMLQQTRVEAVIGYYERFLKALPDIHSLANAPEEQLLKLWEGLGYYNRARNLKKAACVIMDRYNGVFPQTYEDVLSLPGIGYYTAGAIASICFDLPEPAVDGNVLRVLTRFLEDDRVIDLEQTKTAVRELLVPLYHLAPPSVLTQALMELGACVCVPNGAPKCSVCPLYPQCGAALNASWGSYPVRAAKKKRKIEQRIVLVLNCGDRFSLRKRPRNGLLANMWEFPNDLIPADIAESSDRDTRSKQIAELAVDSAAACGAKPVEILQMREYTHIFTHIEWQLTVCYLRCADMPPEFQWITLKELQSSFALPSAFRPAMDGIGP